MPDRSWTNEYTDDLFSAILKLRSQDEAENFFRDLLTLEELAEAAKRWQVAQMVEEGVPYRAIADEIGVSTATVTRVAHWLHSGTGGYRLILSRTVKK